ncbi:peptide-methionine (R)-S-oxide reductase MsrB [Sphingomonas sabuli]|uniref:peptide-methionine (R)-S-oxide reductase n=1 Tax=Sphingomonas sabuli TaxID=2764186 RepID=A0A7G9L129_9SPHN|nr:peptide-methionine (R)-S-oxide reductase MsrB [Sphingomonas sabuli]QNM82328.1 peptide-methionine (R)-S-oxide reductase MsrB [Sphingomonas sabuli]
MLNRREVFGAAGVGAAAVILANFPAGAAAKKYEVSYSPAEWKKRLGPQRYAILREAGTERAYTSPLNKEHRKGLFGCAGCGLPLFSSSTKFDSGTGWPSFYRALPNAVIERVDRSMLMQRTEILCRRCGGHLGHVFDDGPKPTGLRYCMNGLALKFRAA